MGYSEIIAREADLLPLEKQAEVLDFIAFLKVKQERGQTRDNEVLAVPHKTPDEIAAFLRSFPVDTSSYKFDREEANVR